MLLSSAPFVMLRTPLHPLANVSAPPGLTDQVFEEGVYLSAPSFLTELHKGGQPDKVKLETTLSKYWIRSCMRSTPFGTFAGNAIIPVSEAQTDIQLDSPESHRLLRRLDMACLSEIIAMLERNPHIRRQLKYYPNNSMYSVPGRYRYAAFRLNEGRRDYELTEIRSTSYLTAILDAAASGARAGWLAQWLCTAEQVSPEEAEGFIAELISAQVLVSELEPSITGADPLDVLIARLEGIEQVDEYLTKLRDIRHLLRAPGHGAAHCQLVEAAVRRLDPAADWQPPIIQSDLYLAIQHGTINSSLISGLVRQLGELQSLSRSDDLPDLETFKRKFCSLYDDAEVPLSIALDPELGIGYGSVGEDSAGAAPLVDGLPLEAPGPRLLRPSIDPIDQLVASAFGKYLDSGLPELTLHEEDINRISRQVHHRPASRLPASMFLLGSLISDGGPDENDHLFFASGFAGPSAANLLGRFTYGDEQLLRLTRELLNAEEAAEPDAIYAELVHLPQARSGNILFRPVLRGYEIPYIGRSGAAPERQIPIDDLMVSIHDDQLCLRSRKHGRRVIPRLSTAHDFSLGSLPVYKFLCDLQLQGYARPVLWDWGPFSGVKRLPRVRYKNLVLQKARWLIEEADIAGLPVRRSDYPEFFNSFLERHRIPQRAVIAKADHELLIDFGTETGITLFLQELKRHRTIILREFLFSDKSGFVHNSTGEMFVNEMVIPIINGEKERASPTGKTRLATEIRRKFPPSSEWLYVKIYCGNSTAEELLTRTILPFIESGLAESRFERFFFLRYRDEWGHIRIRFFNREISRQADLQSSLQEVLQPMMESGLIHRIVIDTYCREMERYGADLIEAAEAMFHNDSLAVLRTIHSLSGRDGESDRLYLALRGIDMLMDDFGLQAGAKQALLLRLSAGFFKEFGASPSLRKSLNEKYRLLQASLFSHLQAGDDSGNGLEESMDIFRERSCMNGPVIARIRATLCQENDDRMMMLIGDLIHLFMNRMFIGNQRKYELLAYHFLEKYYSSMLAIKHSSAPARIDELLV